MNFYDNGIIKSEGYLVEGKKHGVWYFYSQQGDTISVNRYEAGVMSGRQKYYENNRLTFVETHVKGAENGERIHYYPNGQIDSQGMIINGKQDGEWRMFHDNGQLEKTLYFEMGNIKGPLLNYHPNGRIALKGADANGNGPIEYYDSLGNLVWKMNYVNGVAVDTLEFNPEYLPK